MSAIKPYETPSTHWDTARERDVDMQLDAEAGELDSREKLKEDVDKFFLKLSDSGTVVGTEPLTRIRNAATRWLDRQAAITEREVLDRRIKMKPSLVKVCDDGTFEITAEDIVFPTSDAKAKIAELQAKVDDLQARLDMAHETIDGLRASLDETIAERNELQAKLDEFDGDCYCGATVTEWHDLAARLQDEADVLKAEIGLHVDEHKKLRSQVELKDDIIEGLRQSLDEIMAERNALAAKVEAKEQLERDSAYMRLPVDADGVPIRPGDTIRRTTSAVDNIVTVLGVNEREFFFYGPNFTEPGIKKNIGSAVRHVQPDTVESLLDEFMVALHELGEGADYGPTKERMAERIRKAVEHDNRQ